MLKILWNSIYNIAQVLAIPMLMICAFLFTMNDKYEMAIIMLLWVIGCLLVDIKESIDRIGKIK